MWKVKPSILGVVCVLLLVMSSPAAGYIFSDADGWGNERYYLTIQTADIDGDGADELLGRGGRGMETYDCNTAIDWWEPVTSEWWLWADYWGWHEPQYYKTIQTADVDGDGDDELLGRGAGGMETYDFNTADDSWELLAFNNPQWDDAQSWNQPQYYMTIQTGDVDGDGDDELLGRGAFGIYTYDFNTAGDSWEQVAFDPIWTDAEGWGSPQYYMTIRTADIDGDDADELLGRGAFGIYTYDFNTASNSWELLAFDPIWADTWGWHAPQYYMTIRTADVDGDDADELLGRGGFGMETYDFNTASGSWEPVASERWLWDDVNYDWDHPQYYMTIRTADVDGDDADELLGRGAFGMETYDFNTNSGSWELLELDTVFSDDLGWGNEQYYMTIQTGDINGDGRSELVARSTWGIYTPGYGPVRNRMQQYSYMTIQSAIDYSMNGDEIEVRAGTYNEAINFNGKAIRLYSVSGPDVTTINGTGHYHAVQCVSGEDANTILEGFTITGGNANGSWPENTGGGMLNFLSSPTVTDCKFTGNSAWKGAGMGNDYSNPEVSVCTFSDNSAAYGGGMGNQSSSPKVINCTFSANKAENKGGGMDNGNSSPEVTNCIFSNNLADYGGGMGNYESSPTVTNCTFIGNYANNGGGMYNNNSSPTVTNCILWGDTPDEVNDVNSTSIVTYSDVQGDWNGEGNIDKNPLLYNSARGDLLLTPWSPCIDTGSNDAVAPDATDFTGKPRLVDGDCNGTITVDMGVHEFRHAYGGDFDSSCLVNMADYAVLAWAWLASPQSGNWNPVCDISIPADGYIDAGDVRVLSDNWLRSIDSPVTCDANRLKDEFGLDASGAANVLKELCGITDTFTIEQMLYAAGYEPDEYLEFTAIETVREFVPVLYFDSEYNGLPMSAQVYFETVMSPSPDDPEAGKIKWTTPWDGPCYPNCSDCGSIRIDGRDEWNCGLQNNDFSTLVNGQIPTYYKVISDIDSVEPTGPKGRLRITYWWFYGFQKYCNPLDLTEPGEHHGDWEHIMVTTDPNRTRADAVTYFFHGDWYTRKWPGGFYMVGNRPVVYVGKLAHGSYHNDDHSGWMVGTPHHCCEYADYRNQTESTKWYNAYQNLVSLGINSEPWMLADRIGSTYEYYGREYEIDSWMWGPHISYCDDWLIECINWTHTSACGTHPTDEPLHWQIPSCDEEGCGVNACRGLLYTQPFPHYNQGWPWEGGATSSAAESATSATGVAVASYGSCGASRLGALVRLGEHWLATP